MFSSACSAFSVAASCWATGALFTFSWLERLSGGCGGGGWGRGGRPLPCRWNEAGGGGRPGFSGRSGLLDPGWLVQRTGAVVTVGMGGLLEERTWPYMGGLSGLSGGGPSGRSGGGPLGRSWRGLLGLSGFSGGIGGRFGTTGRSRLFRSPATFSNFSSGGETVTEGVTGAHSVVGAISGIVFSWLGWRSGGMGGNGAGGLRVTRRCILGLKRSELKKRNWHLRFRIYMYVRKCENWDGIFYHISILKWHRQLKSSLEGDKHPCILQLLYVSYSCWWPDDTRSQDISSHDTDLVILEYSGFHARVHFCFKFVIQHFSLSNSNNKILNTFCHVTLSMKQTLKNDFHPRPMIYEANVKVWFFILGLQIDTV